jgi:hypothetical protein
MTSTRKPLARLTAARPPGLTTFDHERKQRDLIGILTSPVEEPAAEEPRAGRVWTPTRARRRPAIVPTVASIVAAAAIAVAAGLPLVAPPRAGQLPQGKGDTSAASDDTANPTSTRPEGILVASARQLIATPAAPAGAYWYQRTRTEVMSLINAYLPPDRQMTDPYWIRASWTTTDWQPTGDGVLYSLGFQDQRFAFLSPHDEARWRASGSPKLDALQHGVSATSQTPSDGLHLGMPLARLLTLEPDAVQLTATIHQFAVADNPPEGVREGAVTLAPSRPGESRHHIKADGTGRVTVDGRHADSAEGRIRPWRPGERERAIAQSMFSITTNWLRYAQQRPSLQAALYEVLSGIDGLRYIGEVTDNVGRSGKAIAMRHDPDPTSGSQTETRLVIDPASGRLLAEQQLLITPPAADQGVQTQPAGTLSYSTAYLDGRWTSKPLIARATPTRG